MRLAAYAILLCTGTTFAQDVAEPGKIADLIKLLEPQPKAQPLQCKVKIVKPTVDFAFRFEAGYYFQMPRNQYSGPDHTWTVLTEVTPQGVHASPVYFLNAGALPELVLQRDSNVGASGGYLLGEGRYSVRWLLHDDLGRTCRSNWRIEAGRKGKFVAMAPNTVSGLSLSETSAQTYTGPGTPMRITLLLDAAPLQVQPESPSGLRGRERAMLFDGLLGLMERLPTSSVRLIVFNLEQQEELLRRENFAVSELGDVARALKELELGSVQLGVLEKPKGHIDLISSLLNAEMHSSSPSDAVVLLGPQERYFDKVPNSALDTPRGNKPRFFSVQFVPPPHWVNAIVPVDAASGYKGGGIIPITIDNFDTVTKVVKKLNGKAVQVLTPDQFENAIKDIELSR
jgi:hypothetical protein